MGPVGLHALSLDLGGHGFPFRHETRKVAHSASIPLKVSAPWSFWVYMSNETMTDEDMARINAYYARGNFETAVIRGAMSRLGDLKFDELTDEDVEAYDYNDRQARWQAYSICRGVDDYQLNPVTGGMKRLSDVVEYLRSAVANGDPRGASWVIVTPLRDREAF